MPLREDAQPFPAQLLLTRALGIQTELEVELCTDSPAPGDVYLLCSNGLAGVLGASELASTLLLERALPCTAQILWQRASQLGGADNMTLMLVRVVDSR